MNGPATIAEAWAGYAADQPQSTHLDERAQRRAFYAGALFVLTHTGPATRDQLLAEIVMFGRTVGRDVETAD